MNYRFSTQAQQDIRDITTFIKQKNPSAAKQLIRNIMVQCKTLAQFPEMGRDRSELAPALRSFPVGNYLIFYRPIQNEIEVARVISGYRDVTAIFAPEAPQ